MSNKLVVGDLIEVRMTYYSLLNSAMLYPIQARIIKLRKQWQGPEMDGNGDFQMDMVDYEPTDPKIKAHLEPSTCTAYLGDCRRIQCESV